MKEVLYLSEIQKKQIEACAVLILFGGAALIAAAKGTLVIVGVVLILGVTYELAKVTRAFLDTRVKETTNNQDNLKIYYPAQRIDGFLSISSVPMHLSIAAPQLASGRDYYTPKGIDAKRLADSAGGSTAYAEVDNYNNVPITAHYYHYHLWNRTGGHSFFGYPIGGTYAK